MSTEGQAARDVTDAVQQHLPSVVAVLLGGWAWMMRLALGRQLAHADKTALDISEIKERLARIEGHLGVHRDGWDVE